MKTGDYFVIRSGDSLKDNGMGTEADGKLTVPCVEKPWEASA